MARNADFTQVQAQNADFGKAQLTDAKLNAASLARASFLEAVARNADFSKADLSGAALQGTDLTAADLSGATLTGANLSGASLSGATLRGAKVSRIQFDGSSLLVEPSIRHTTCTVSLARIASGCTMSISVRVGFASSTNQYLGVTVRDCNGQRFGTLSETGGWCVKEGGHPSANGVQDTTQAVWSFKGQVIKVVVDALAGRVSFHSAASGQTVVMDGLPKGELWLAAGLYSNSATLVAVECGGVRLDLN